MADNCRRKKTLQWGIIMFRYSPHPHSQLIHDDLSARLAPLDRYGLAECASVLVDGVVALANWSQGSLMRQLDANARKPGRA